MIRGVAFPKFPREEAEYTAVEAGENDGLSRINARDGSAQHRRMVGKRWRGAWPSGTEAFYVIEHLLDLVGRIFD